jgi:hypothetical protein
MKTSQEDPYDAWVILLEGYVLQNQNLGPF